MVGVKVGDSLQINEVYTLSWQAFKDGYFFKGESHNFYEVVCVLKGKVGITAGKNVFVLSENQMTVHYPGEFHAIWEEGDTAPECIIFSFSAPRFPTIKGSVYAIKEDLMKELVDLYFFAQDVFIIESEASSFETGNAYDGDTAENLGKTAYRNGVYVTEIKKGKEISASTFIKRLEIFLLQATDSCVSGTTPVLRESENYAKIMAVLDDNLGKSLTLSDISDLCGMSVPAIEKTIFKYLHIGVIKYYNELKMERACAMLSNGLNVKQTAQSLGFSNQNYFSAAFKKRYGYSPSKLKRC